jgi:membrane peptidoglycan carboxypeptidase
LNIPAVKMIYLTGIDKVLDFADKLGYTTLKDRSRYGLSLVLGGGEVTLLEHAQAYSVFAQEGLLHPTNPLLKVEDRDGSVIEEFQKTEKQALDPQVCRLLSSILTDNDARTYIFGAKNYLTLNDRLVAAKTGTTNNFRDAWTMGYTPSRVVGVWVGNSNNSAMKSGADGSQIAAPIWQKVMTAAVAKIPAENFTAPDPINTDKPVLNGKVGISTIVKIDKSSGKLATSLTPADYIIEKTITQYHNILYYINKDNPQGAAPDNPWQDPQFTRWEEPVMRWVKQNNLESAIEIPTEQDTSHTLENQPSLTINTPQENQTIKEKILPLNIIASAKRGISKLDVVLDNKTLYSGLFVNNLNLDLTSFTTGFHILTISVEDDVGNKQTKSLDLNLLF